MLLVHLFWNRVAKQLCKEAQKFAGPFQSSFAAFRCSPAADEAWLVKYLQAFIKEMYSLLVIRFLYKHHFMWLYYTYDTSVDFDLTT